MAYTARGQVTITDVYDGEDGRSFRILGHAAGFHAGGGIGMYPDGGASEGMVVLIPYATLSGDTYDRQVDGTWEGCTSNVGDCWIADSDRHLYMATEDSGWMDCGLFNGRDGADGEDGDNGEDGLSVAVELTPQTVAILADSDGYATEDRQWQVEARLKADGNQCELTAVAITVQGIGNGVTKLKGSGKATIVGYVYEDDNPEDYEGTVTVVLTGRIGGRTCQASGTISVNGQRCGRDGTPGPSGARGKAFWMAGDFNSSVRYTSDEYSTPVVHVKDATTDEWYYLITESNDWGQGGYAKPTSGNYASYAYIPPTSAYPKVWGRALDMYRVVMTEALFTDFAKLGSAVIIGDYMLSQNGYINGVEYADGKEALFAQGFPTISNSASRPAYTYFGGDPQNLSAVSGRFTGSGPVSGTPYVVCRFTMQAQGTASVVASKGGDDANLGNTFVVIRNAVSKVVTRSFLMLGVVDNVSGEASLPAATYELCIYSNNASYARDVQVSIAFPEGGATGTYVETGTEDYLFRPCWWVDLRTGKMSGANGNFVLNPDGSITAAAGNFTVDAAGNVTLEGTIRAKTLYRNVARVSVNDEMMSADDLLTETGGTLPAVLVLFNNTHSTTGEIIRNVELPPAVDWQGHEMEVVVQARMYVNSNTKDLYAEIHLATTNDECFNDPAGSRPTTNSNQQGWAYVKQKSAAAVTHAFNWASYRLRILSTNFEGRWRWAVLEMDDAVPSYSNS